MLFNTLMARDHNLQCNVTCSSGIDFFIFCGAMSKVLVVFFYICFGSGTVFDHILALVKLCVNLFYSVTWLNILFYVCQRDFSWMRCLFEFRNQTTHLSVTRHDLISEDL